MQLFSAPLEHANFTLKNLHAELNPSTQLRCMNLLLQSDKFPRRFTSVIEEYLAFVAPYHSSVTNCGGLRETSTACLEETRYSQWLLCKTLTLCPAKKTTQPDARVRHCLCNSILQLRHSYCSAALIICSRRIAASHRTCESSGPGSGLVTSDPGGGNRSRESGSMAAKRRRTGLGGLMIWGGATTV